MNWKILFIWLIAINLITFAAFGIDKRKAVKGKFRISEATLFVMSLAGGSPGGLAAMYAFRHKTKKWYFKFGIPLILVLQLAVICFILKKGSMSIVGVQIPKNEKK